MTNLNGAPDNSLDFDPNANYLEEMKVANGEVSQDAVDPAFEVATLASVAETNNPAPDVNNESQIKALAAVLKGESVVTQEEDWATTPDRAAVAALNAAQSGEKQMGIEERTLVAPEAAATVTVVNRAVEKASQEQELNELFDVPTTSKSIESALNRNGEATRNIETTTPESKGAIGEYGNEEVAELEQYIGKSVGNVNNIDDAISWGESNNREKRTKILNVTAGLGATSLVATLGTAAATGVGLTVGFPITAGILAVGGAAWGVRKGMDWFRARKAKKMLTNILGE